MRPLLFSLLPILVFGLIMTGCRGGKVKPTSGSGAAGQTAAGAGSGGESVEQDLLVSAIHQLHPETYAIAAAPDKPITLLNSWREMVKEPAGTDLGIPEGWVNAADQDRLKLGNYDVLDATYIRNSLLNHAIIQYLSARANTELDQAQAVFDFAIRNIALRGDDDPDFPLQVYETLLLGRGKAEDRAMVIAALLKQMRIDSVVIRPANEAASEGEAWLLGLLLNGQVYLYDPRLGIAIPSSEELAKSTAPATLRDIVAHPEWLKPLTIRSDQPYPITVESLKNIVVSPIVEPSSWTNRMKHLESMLPANDLCVLYDPLIDEGERVGLLTRLKKQADWKIEDMKPWSYPQEQFAATLSANDAVKRAFSMSMQSFNLPIPFAIDPETNQAKLGNPERKLLKIRTEQLLGKFEEATQRYLSIRHLEIEPTPIPELMLLNRMGAENAWYWTGLCKFESGDYESAVEQLSGYLKRFERNGQWRASARAVLADCHARLGHYKEAIAVLERSRSDDPYRTANAIRVKRWSALAQ